MRSDNGSMGFFNPLECGLTYPGHVGNFIIRMVFQEVQSFLFLVFGKFLRASFMVGRVFSGIAFALCRPC